MTSPQSTPPPNVPVPWYYKVALIFVCLFTLTTFIAALIIGSKYPELKEGQKMVLDLCKSLCSGGFGAILGLLGGKAGS